MSKQETIQVSLRLAPDVYEMLKAKTGETGRSLNAEIIQAIIEHCDLDSLAARVDKLERSFIKLEAAFPVSTNPPATSNQT